MKRWQELIVERMVKERRDEKKRRKKLRAE